MTDRRNAENAALRENIAELEKAGNDYADLMLMDTTVHVDMEKITAAFHLPPAADEAFRDWSAPAPQLIESLNLDLTYDRFDQQFSVSTGGVVFDNGYGLAFAAPHAIRGEEGKFHDIDIFTTGANGRPHMRRIGPSPTEHVQGFFNQCGVPVPMTPDRAEWESVVPTLALAMRGVVTAQKSTIVSPTQELLVSEQTVATHGDNGESGWLKEVSLQVVEYEDMAVRSLEAVLRTGSPFEAPRFRGVYAHNTPRALLATPQASGGELVPLSPQLTEHVASITEAVRAANWL